MQDIFRLLDIMIGVKHMGFAYALGYTILITIMILYTLGSIGVGVICYLITKRIIPSVLLAIICLISVPTYWKITDKIEKEKYAKLKQEWIQEAHRRRNNLLQACKTESKMTVYQKIPEKSDIFFEQIIVDKGIPGQSVPHPEAAEMKFELRKLIEKCKNTEGKSSKSCYEQFEWSITWHSYFKDTIQRYAHTDFVYEVPIEDDSKTYHFTPYRFIVEDISSITDRQNGIRRGKMLLKNIKTNQIVSEYIGFEVVPYGTTIGRSHSAVNCFSNDKEWNEHIQNGNSNSALSSGDDGAVFEHFFNHAVDKSKKVAKPKLKK